VHKARSTNCDALDPIDVWQNKIRTLRRMVRCWANNVVVELNKYKHVVDAEYNVLDEEDEHRMLDESEKSRKKHLASELEQIWRLEEIRTKQRSRDRNVLEGDRNTAYFHAVANQRCSKKRIEYLRVLGGSVHDTPGVLRIAKEYYKTLFS
jgi:hypothetical protein